MLGLQDDPRPLVGGIMERIQRAQLSRLQLDWGGLDVFETYPARLGELWAGKPVFLLGRYRGDGAAQLTLSGLAEGQPVSFTVPIALAGASAKAEEKYLPRYNNRNQNSHIVARTGSDRLERLRMSDFALSDDIKAAALRRTKAIAAAALAFWRR